MTRYALIVALLLTAACTQPPAEVIRRSATVSHNGNAPLSHDPRIRQAQLQGTITVGRGDTLRKISTAVGIPVERIIALNHLTEPYRIQVGQKLRLSSKLSSEETVAARSPEPRPEPLQLKPVQAAPKADIATKDLAELTAPSKPEISHIAPQKEIVLPHPDPNPAPPAKLVSLPETKKEVSEPALKAAESHGFIWPVKGKLITGYGTRKSGMRNDGINIAAPEGAKVRATAAGTVLFAGQGPKGYGNLVLIQHDSGFVSAYAHNKAIFVDKGDIVEQGQMIAQVGRTGNVRRPQLHFSLRKNEDAVDPRTYLKR